MTTILVVHEVDDVDPLAALPQAEEVFGPLGFTMRTFVDPTDPRRVGLIIERPGLDTLREFLRTDAAADALKEDGVRPDTLVTLVGS